MQNEISMNNFIQIYKFSIKGLNFKLYSLKKPFKNKAIALYLNPLDFYKAFHY